MHGVPDDLDLSAFVGHSVRLLSIDRYQIQIYFQAPEKEHGLQLARPGHLGIEGNWELRGPTAEVIDLRVQPEADRDVYRIHKLLDRAVVSWRPLTPTAFELVFSGGYSLRVIEDDPQYEFCAIHIPGDSGGGLFL
jgi:hypothetical protein